jgi:spermidine/putrescine transport system permease protein
MKSKASLLPQKKTTEIFLTLPSLGWLIFFFTIPILILFTLAFKESSYEGNLIEGFSMKSFHILWEKSTLLITLRTIWISLLTTFLSVLISIPLAYTLARLSKRAAQTILLFIFIPTWSCFLVRIFAWKTLLHPDGFVKELFVLLGLCSESASLLYNDYAVLFAMLYSYSSFALLPIYGAASKFNFQLLDAAHDLGASHFTSFMKIFLPNIMHGCRTGALLVLIPAAGAYVIPDLVGGAEAEMLGNKISQRIFFDRNIPEACVLSLLLVFVIILLSFFLTRSKKTGTPSQNKKWRPFS